MSEQFKLGEVAVIRNDPAMTEPGCERYEGQDVVVVGPLMWRIAPGDGKPFWCYEVHASDGVSIFAAPHELRKKRPPRRECDEVVSWEECAWMPMCVKLDRAIERAKQQQAA